MIVGVLACSKRKLPYAAPALELYQGDVFKLAQTYLASIGCTRLVILSALHGAVPGDRVLAPYDCALTSYSARDRRRWAARAGAQLRELVPTGARVVAILPGPYAAALDAAALDATTLERHFAGLTLGRLKQAIARALPRPAEVA